MKKVLLLLLITLTITTGCGKAKLVNGEQIIASIDGMDISAEKLFEEMKEQGGMAVLIDMVDKAIIKKEKIDETEVKKESQTYLDNLKAQYTQMGQDFETILKSSGFESEKIFLDLLIVDNQKQAVAKKYIKKDIKDEEINNYYENQISGKLSVKHILVKFSEEDLTDEEILKNEEETLAKAKSIIEKLNNGEDFDKLVKEYSEDPGSVEKNGLYEDFVKGDMVDAFYEASVALKNNEYTKEPIKTEYGYHIILKIKQDKKPTLKESKEEIIKALVENKISENSNLISETWIKIRKNYKLNISDSTIKKAYNNSIK